ncbi:MAG: dTDP-4-dehydrorhamnose reductase [Nitrospirae bacterium]|nr:dTDP-4-dehydrorhamnose reductase [Nitrospirota bacterium]
MKVLLIGAKGQLATALRPRLEAAGHQVAGLTHEECDLASPAAVSRQLDAHTPEAVINAAAYNQVDRSETAIEEAFAVNGYGPGGLATACAARRIALMHVSTNYVFDGRRDRPYDEADGPNPLSVYGLSKLAGERLVQAHASRSFIVRTTGLYGRHAGRKAGENFVERILTAASNGAPLRVVNDQIATPTYTGHLAEAMARLLATTAYGLYHLTNSGGCSWWEFTRAILDRAGVRAEVQPVSSEAFGSAALRPAFSVLVSRRSAGAGLPPLPTWQEGLDAYFRERGERLH